MASLSEQIRAAVKTALLATPQITGVAGRVDRGREDAYSEREKGSINIRAEDEQTRVMSSTTDDNELIVEIEIYVAPEVDWETAADAIFVQLHARLLGYAGWEGLVARVRKVSMRWAGDSGNRTPGLLTLRYVFRFLSQAAAVDAQPVS